MHAFEREQKPTPQLNNTMTAAETEESVQSPLYCIWRSWSCLARVHILHVLVELHTHAAAVLFPFYYAWECFAEDFPKPEVSLGS